MNHVVENLFVGPKLKIERSDRHIQDLNRILEAFFATEFYRFQIRKGADGSSVLEFETTRGMPSEIPLVIGDAVHNLRAALDLLVCDVVTLAGNAPGKGTQFPFGETREEVVAAVHDGIMGAAPAGIVDLIIDTVKPYRGGNEAMCALDDLDIVDRRRLLTPIIAVTGIVGASWIDERGKAVHGMTLTVGEGGRIDGMPANSRIRNPGTLAFGVFFDKGQVFEGRPVVRTLHQLTQVVSGVVHTVEQAYAADARPLEKSS
jgi:hypothetical protein